VGGGIASCARSLLEARVQLAVAAAAMGSFVSPQEVAQRSAWTSGYDPHITDKDIDAALARVTPIQPFERFHAISKELRNAVRDLKRWQKLARQTQLVRPPPPPPPPLEQVCLQQEPNACQPSALSPVHFFQHDTPATCEVFATIKQQSRSIRDLQLGDMHAFQMTLVDASIAVCEVLHEIKGTKGQHTFVQLCDSGKRAVGCLILF